MPARAISLVFCDLLVSILIRRDLDCDRDLYFSRLFFLEKDLTKTYNNTKVFSYHSTFNFSSIAIMTHSPKTSQNQHLVCLPGGNRNPREKSYSPIPKPPENAIARSNSANSEQFTLNLQRLEEQAIRINQLSAELETAISEFKEIGDRVDFSSVHFRKNLGHHWFPERICSYREVKLPYIYQTGNGVLVLSSRRISLAGTDRKAQREANLVADLLRQRNLAKQSF